MPSAAQLAGPMLLGFGFNWGLFGLLTMQVYIYKSAFPNDSWKTKTLVYILCVLEMAQTILVTRDSFQSFAIRFGDLEIFNDVQAECFANPFLSGIISSLVQLYYAYLLMILSGSWRLSLVIAVISLGQGICAIVQAVQCQVFGHFSTLFARAFPTAIVWLAGSATCDVLIASCMTYFLIKKDTGISSTHALITKLVRLIVETGTLTAMTAVLVLILVLVDPNIPYFTCPAIVLVKLYSNSLLVILNSRMRIVRANGTPSTGTGDSVTFSRVLGRKGNNRGAGVAINLPSNTDLAAPSLVGPMEVRMDKETWTDGEAIPMDYTKSRDIESQTTSIYEGGTLNHLST